jgi:hypothetical protein
MFLPRPTSNTHLPTISSLVSTNGGVPYHAQFTLILPISVSGVAGIADMIHSVQLLEFFVYIDFQISMKVMLEISHTNFS